MDGFRADLHCHSTCSDGTDSPLELLSLAKHIGLNGLAITDHDTLQAYANIFPISKEMGIDLISGVEFSATLDSVSVHLLGYGFSPTHPTITHFCSRHHIQREERNKKIIEKLSKMGMPITLDDILQANQNKLETIGRPHIALTLLKKGYVSSFNDAFKLYLAEGKPAFVQESDISVEETLEILHDVKGFAIIAHPHLIKNNKTLNKLLEMNFDGLEGYYGNFNKHDNERWVKKALKKNWIVTGGSDYHGHIKPHISLGSSWTGEEIFTLFKNRFTQNHEL